ncbi:RimK family alpha-L-glutamate ligase [Streptomyces sp. NPDC059558]|uniref:ATP-grasp domain-containing protein n=1 Tax=Streptomyces sp. NPDC059558 TaxID=3346864 RepID=UPI00367A695F
MGTARVAIVTSEGGADADADLPLILAALRGAGVSAQAVAWDADRPQWDGFDLAVIRSTWDYADRLPEFLAWADATAEVTRLWNPAPLVRWNSDKRYLLELARHKVPVVPTRFLEPGGSFHTGGSLDTEDFDTEDFDGPHGVVVKPAVSSGARDTARYEPGRGADAERHARMLLDRGRTAMVQPYLPLVAEGERALVFFGGSFSHAIRKQPLLTEAGLIDNFRVPHPGAAPYEPSEAELRTVRAALAAVPAPGELLFARVDLALDEAREPVLMELELIEPNLFLGINPHGLERLTEAVAAALTATR